MNKASNKAVEMHHEYLRFTQHYEQHVSFREYLLSRQTRAIEKVSNELSSINGKLDTIQKTIRQA